MTRNRTENALIAKGIDSATAHRLRVAKHTVASLLQSSQRQLREFGVKEDAIAAFYSKSRPPIPSPVLSRVLYANRWTCCVCRETERPIIVHHIKEWAKSRDHSIANLAVLCTYHHGEAHNARGLELSLKPSRLLECKRNWENFCKNSDLILSLKKSEERLNTWFYFNHLRIYELAKELNINLKLLRGFSTLRELNSCDKNGAILKAVPKRGYMYDDTDRIPLYDYVSDMYFTVIQKLGVINISDYLDKGVVSQLVLPGDIILVQGLHTFSPVSRAKNAREVSEVWRKSNRVRVSCTIDLGEATSNSSWCNWLRGQKNIATILKVREMCRVDGELQIRGTALAIRDQDDELKKRNYLQRLYESGVRLRQEYDDADGDIADGEASEVPGAPPDEL